MSFGSRIIQLRDEQEMSRRELSDKLGIAYQTLSKYETDSRFPDRETLMIIADNFEVSVDYLLGRTKHRRMGEYKPLASPLDYKGLSNDELSAIQNMIDLIKKFKNR